MVRKAKPIKQTRGAYQGAGLKPKGRKLSKSVMKKRVAQHHLGRNRASRIGESETPVVDLNKYLMLVSGTNLLLTDGSKLILTVQ